MNEIKDENHDMQTFVMEQLSEQYNILCATKEKSDQDWDNCVKWHKRWEMIQSAEHCVSIIEERKREEKRKKSIMDYSRLLPSTHVTNRKPDTFSIDVYLTACVEDDDWMKDRTKEEFTTIDFSYNSLQPDDFIYIYKFIQKYVSHNPTPFELKLNGNKLIPNPLVKYEHDIGKMLLELSAHTQVLRIHMSGNTMAQQNTGGKITL